MKEWANDCIEAVVTRHGLGDGGRLCVFSCDTEIDTGSYATVPAAFWVGGTGKLDRMKMV